MVTIREALQAVKGVEDDKLELLLTLLQTVGFAAEQNAFGAFMEVRAQHLPADGRLTTADVLVLERAIKLLADTKMRQLQQENAQPKAGITSRLSAERSHTDIIAGLQRLAELLVTLEVPERGSPDPFMRVPHDMHPFVPAALRTSVYMRRDYHLALDRIVQAAAPALHVISGTPGVGKSAFALPLASALAKRREKVLYIHSFQFFGLVVVLLDFADPNSPRVDYACGAHGDLFRMIGHMLDATAFTIVDGKAPDAQWFGKGRTVVLAPPDASSFNKFAKGGDAQVMYFNPWSLPSLQRCRAALYSHVPKQLVAERYAAFGGSLRLVLVKLSYTLENLKKEFWAGHAGSAMRLHLLGTRHIFHTMVHILTDGALNMRCLTLASPAAAALVAEWWWGVQAPQKEATLTAGLEFQQLGGFAGMMFKQHGHKLLSSTNGIRLTIMELQPLASDGQRTEGTNRTEQIRLRPRVADCTDMVQPEDGIAEPAEGNSQGAAGSAMLSSDDESDVESHHIDADGHASSIGANEGNMAVAATAAGEQDAAKLSKQLGSHLVFGPPGKHPVVGGTERFFKVKQCVWESPSLDLSTLESGTYVQPPSAANAAWDALLVMQDVTYILQYTVSKEHGIMAVPLAQLLERLGTKQVVLLFMVPRHPAHDMAVGFHRQHYTSKNGGHLQWRNVTKDVQALRQFVASLPVSRAPDVGTSGSAFTYCSRSKSAGGVATSGAAMPEIGCAAMDVIPES